MKIKFLTVTTFLVASSLLLTSCAPNSLFKSEAFKAGYKIGDEFGSYVNKGNIDTINSWLPDTEKIDVNSTVGTKEIADLCDAMFDISGLLAGLENSDSNRSDFKKGCISGFNSASNA